ncbi:PaaI family thioesterase, partial [Clostridium sp. AF02-29]|uniref:PaaI family thioesterase n=2 Tax=Bacillota TaxID=1239 RepID=UPI0023578133
MITRPEILEGIRRHIQPIRGQENLKLLEIEPGHARLSIEITEECLNLYGNAHGGFLFSLCDIAAGMSTYAYEVVNVTQCAGINFVKGVNSGTVYVEANAVHKGRKTVVTRVDIT